MSASEFPSEASADRQERAKQCTILDTRIIEGKNFGFPDEFTVYELDLINDRGETRENVTIIPRVLFENTKDVQHRHDDGIVGKYSRALAMENDQAEEALLAGIEDRRDEIQEEMSELRSADSRLLHTAADLNGL